MFADWHTIWNDSPENPDAGKFHWRRYHLGYGIYELHFQLLVPHALVEGGIFILVPGGRLEISALALPPAKV